MVYQGYVFLRSCRFGIFLGYSVVRLFTNSSVDSCFHASRLLSSCTVGHTARPTPLTSPFGRVFRAFSFDRFRPLLETCENACGVFVFLSCVLFRPFLPSLKTGGNTRSVFVFPSSVLFRRLFSPSHKRPAGIIVTLLPSSDLFRPLGPARTVVPFFLSPFAFLRLTVGRVSELLIRIVSHRSSDASV